MTNKELLDMVSELFERLRKQETASVVLSEKVDKLTEELHNHTREEMHKYAVIEAKIARFEKIGWIIMGLLLSQTEPISSVFSTIFKIG